jgi:DNA uptake protein ComE-like DNA-binding protein
MPSIKRALTVFCSITIAVGSSGCGLVQSDSKTDQERAQKTRDEVAKATERAKPELQKAGRELKDAAKTAAEQAHAAAQGIHAAAQGIKEGWERGGKHSVDLNSASESELMALPGITRRDARQIIAGRPYSSGHELVNKGVLSEERYSEIRDRITLK